jgi:hypothetical protein
MPTRILPVDLRFKPPPPTDEGIDYTNLVPPIPPAFDDELTIPQVFTWPPNWTPWNWIDEGIDNTNLFVPPPVFDDGNELPISLFAPRPMSKSWISWTPVAVTSDEIQSIRTKILEEVPPAILFPQWRQPLKDNVWWTFQMYPLAAAGVEDSFFQPQLVCTPVVLVSGWIFSPGLQHGSIYATGMQQGQTAKAGQ